MPKTCPKHHDFDDWLQLARTDPQAFERRRKAVIDAFIDAAPAERRQRLRRLQWRIDAERSRASNPTAAWVKLSNMMWESLAGERGLAAAFENPVRLLAKRSAAHSPRASVLPFPRRN